MSSDADSRVTVKLRRGAWEMEISAREDRIQQAVESALAGMASREPASIEIGLAEAAGEKQRGTCRSILLTMWKERYFAESKVLSEVDEEIIRRGYHFDRTAVSHTLADLVREGTLFREGSQRTYRYVQKRPLQSTSEDGKATEGG